MAQNKKLNLNAPVAQLNYKLLVCLIIAIGIFFRLYHFFYNRSLWEDEIYLSSGIINHSITDIFTKPLPYLQKAPTGYLLLARFFVSVFGNTEIGLRFFPLLCGILSLFVFLPVAKYFLKQEGLMIALCIFSFAPPLVYHSVEAKPYITELLATLIIIRLYIAYQHEEKLSKLLIWGLSGAVIVWFAYSAIFIFAACGITIIVPYLRRKNRGAIFKICIASALCLVSFVISYLLYAKEGSGSGWLVDFWLKQDGYMPLKPVAAITWLTHHLFSFFHYPLGLSWYNSWEEHNVFKQIAERMAFVPLLLIFTGAIYFYGNKKNFLLLTASVFLIAFTASALKLYPMSERLMTYLSPFLVLLIAGGCQFFFHYNLPLKITGAVLSLLLVAGPLANSVYQVFNPYLFGDYKKSYQREALFYLNRHYKPGDLVYVYWNDLPGFTLYKKMYGFQFKGIIGKDYRKKSVNFEDYFNRLEKDFAPLKGKKRVWIVNNNHIDIPVGDYVGQPSWYYKQHNGILRFHEWLLSKAMETDIYKTANKNAISDINVSLMDFSVKP